MGLVQYWTSVCWKFLVSHLLPTVLHLLRACLVLVYAVAFSSSFLILVALILLFCTTAASEGGLDTDRQRDGRCLTGRPRVGEGSVCVACGVWRVACSV
jgi:hypothetical protein